MLSYAFTGGWKTKKISFKNNLQKASKQSKITALVVFVPEVGALLLSRLPCKGLSCPHVVPTLQSCTEGLTHTCTTECHM